MKLRIPYYGFLLLLVILLGGRVPSVDAEILVTLESPPNKQKVSGIGAVAGWAFSNDAAVTISQIRLRIDEKPADGSLGEIAFPGERSDVAQANPTFPQALKSGFSYNANFSALSAGAHKIGVEIIDSQGKSKIIDHEVTVVRVGNFPLLQTVDLSGADPKIDGKQIRLPFTEVLEKPADDKTEAKVQQVRLTLGWQPERQAFGIIDSENTSDPTRPTNNILEASAVSTLGRDARSAEGDTIRYVLENPSPFASTVSGKGLISGWAFSTSANTKVEKIDLKVDGTSVQTIPCCTLRTDVAATTEFKDFPQSERSGFSTVVNFNNLDSSKTHDLDIEIQTGNDKTTIPLKGLVAVRLGSLDFIDDVDLSNATVSVTGNSLLLEKFKVIGKDRAGQVVSTEVTADFSWEASCQCFVTLSSCGDGNIEPGEECDGNTLADQTCSSLGFSGGNLSCTDTCVLETKDCTGGQSLYVTNVRSDSVSVVNTATNTVTTTIPVGGSPRGIAIHPNGATAYVANSADDTLSVINIANNAVSATVPVGKGPQGVVVTPDGGSIYVVNGLNNTVSVLDAATNQIRTNIPVGKEPQLITLALNGKFAYVTNYGGNSVSVIDTNTNAVTKVITANIGKGPNGVAASPDGSQVYVTAFDGDSLSIINTATNDAATPILLGLQPTQIAFSTDGAFAYISSVLDFSVIEFDTAKKVLTTTEIPIFETRDRAEPEGIVVSPNGRRIYIAGFGRNAGGDAINVVSTASKGVVGLIEVGKGPYGVALTPPK